MITHFVVHTDVKLQCCTPKTYIMLCSGFIRIKKSTTQGSPNAFWLKKIVTESTNWLPGAPEREANRAERMAGHGATWSETQANWGDRPPKSWRHCGPTSVKDSFLSISKHFLQQDYLLHVLICFFCEQSSLKFRFYFPEK